MAKRLPRHHAAGRARNSEAPARRPAIRTDSSKTDFGVVVALQEELAAMLSALGKYEEVDLGSRDIRHYYRSFVHCQDGSEQSVVCVKASQMGQLAAQNAASDLISGWKPRHLLLVGIAGGVASRGAQLGDVVVPNRIHYYEPGKLTPGSRRLRGPSREASPRLLTAVDALAMETDPRWHRQISASKPANEPGVPRIVRGDMASGEDVWADEEAPAVREVLSRWDKVVTVDTEAGGVFSAAAESTQPPDILVVKAVSDLADTSKNDDWHGYAADAAAAFAVAVIEKIGGRWSESTPSDAEPVASQAAAAGAKAGVAQLLRIPPALVGDIDPYEIGVSRSSIAEAMSGDQLRPPYVGRSVDDCLDAAISKRRIALLIGDSKSGKSRSAYEAIRRCCPDATLLVAGSPNANSNVVRELLARDRHRSVPGKSYVLWFDDVLPFLATNALDISLILRIQREFPEVALIATMQAVDYEKLHGWDGSETELAAEVVRILDVLGPPCVLQSELTTLAEQISLSTTYPGLRLPKGRGLGAFLIGGARMLEKLAEAPIRKPERAAVIYSAIDYRRIGVDRPISRDELSQLFPQYLRELAPEREPDDALMQEALDWATAPESDVPSVSLLRLEPNGGYVPFDYLVAARSGDLSEASTDVHRPIPKFTWDTAIRLLDPTSLLSVGLLGVLKGEVDHAEGAWRQASGAVEPYPAAASSVNLGVLLSHLGRYEESVSVFESVEKRFGEARSLVLREHVAKATISRGSALGRLNRVDAEIGAYKALITRLGTAHEPALQDQVATAIYNTAVAFSNLGRSADAIAAYRDLVDRFGSSKDPGLREQTGMALVNLTSLLRQSQRPAEAITTSNEVLRRYGDSPEPGLQVQVAMAMINEAGAVGEAGRPEDEISGYQRVVDRFGAVHEPKLRSLAAGALVLKAVALERLDRRLEAVAVDEEVVARYGEDHDPRVQIQVSTAMFNRALAFDRLARPDQAIAAYTEVSTRYGQAQEPALRSQASIALFNKGHRLAEQGDHEAAVSAFDEAIAHAIASTKVDRASYVRHGLQRGLGLGQLATYDDQIASYRERSCPALGPTPVEGHEEWAAALVNKGLSLGQLGSYEMEMETYRQVIDLFGEASEPELPRQVAMAMVDLGTRLAQLQRTAEAIPVFRGFVTKFDANDEEEMRLRVAIGRVRLSSSLAESGSLDEAANIANEVVSRYIDSRDPGFQRQVAAAMMVKCFCFDGLGRLEELIAGCDQVISRFGGSDEVELRGHVIRATYNKAAATQDAAEAIGIYDAALARLGEQPAEPALRELQAKCLVNKANRLEALGRDVESLACATAIVDRLDNASDVAMRRQLARALSAKSSALAALGRETEAIAALHELIERFGGEESIEFVEEVVRARFNRGVLLGQTGQPQQAAAAYEELIRALIVKDGVEPRAEVAMALFNRGVTLGELDRHDQEISCFEELMSRFGASGDPTVRELVADVSKRLALRGRLSDLESY